MMLVINNIQPADQLLKEAQEIQNFLESEYSGDVPAACEARGASLEQYMARSGKMLADAKYWQDQFVNSAISDTIKEALSAQKVYTPSVINKKIDALAKDYNYMVTWCGRLNATCTHQLDFVRTLISKHKEEMRQMAFSGRP